MRLKNLTLLEPFTFVNLHLFLFAATDVLFVLRKHVIFTLLVEGPKIGSYSSSGP